MNKCWKCAQEQVGGTPCNIHSASSCMVDSVVRLSGDGTDRLCMAVYGRPAEPRDYIGGANAQMLYDAADMIESLQPNE